MLTIKKFGLCLGLVIGIFMSIMLFTTILSYFNIISDSTTEIFKILSSIISLFVGGLILGKKSNKKGWLEGIKLSIGVIILMTLANYFIFDKFEAKILIYYLILIISTVAGSMIGINKKRT